METMKAIQCINCGGVMYPDQKHSSYTCPFCGSSVPWCDDNYYRPLPLQFRHKPVQQVDGLIKLGHVEINDHLHFHNEGVLSRRYRLNSVADKLDVWDSTTTTAFAGIEQVRFNCPFCNVEVIGNSNQSIFECKACGNKLGVREALRPGAYRKEFIMGVGAENVPPRAIPFKVTPEQARHCAAYLVRSNLQHFEGQDMERRIAETMRAVYIPFTLADLSLKISVDSNIGTFELYQEIVNWACPDTALFDAHLLERLDPWDFGAVCPFDPAFMAGDIRVAAVTNNYSRTDLMDNLLTERLEHDIRETFGLRQANVLSCARDLRKHKGGWVLLPVYYIDRRPGNTDVSVQVRMAVNGQTGSAAALFLKGDAPGAYITICPPAHTALSCESTIRTGMIPIKKVRSPLLYQILPLEKAVRKKSLARLFSRS